MKDINLRYINDKIYIPFEEHYEILREEVKEKIRLREEIERLNNDIKELLKNSNKEKKVIIAQDNIIKEVREYINKIPTQPVIRVFKKELLEILDKEKNK